MLYATLNLIRKLLITIIIFSTHVSLLKGMEIKENSSVVKVYGDHKCKITEDKISIPLQSEREKIISIKYTGGPYHPGFNETLQINYNKKRQDDEFSISSYENWEKVDLLKLGNEPTLHIIRNKFNGEYKIENRNLDIIECVIEPGTMFLFPSHGHMNYLRFEGSTKLPQCEILTLDLWPSDKFKKSLTEEIPEDGYLVHSYGFKPDFIAKYNQYIYIDALSTEKPSEIIFELKKPFKFLNLQ